MTTEQQLVKDWMQKFGQETPDKPTMPSLEVRKLRAKLILEEALECIEALGLQAEWTSAHGSNYSINNTAFYELYKNNKKVEPNLSLLADGLADLHYVAYCGTANACGLDMEPIFEEVHRSNMSKLWTDEEINGLSTMLISCAQCGNQRIRCFCENLIPIRNWLVKDQSGKVIKSPSFSPPNLTPLIK